MKIKNKLWIDLVIVVLLFICMKYTFTGGLIHEILGLVLLAGFLLHVCINRKYFTALKRIFTNKNSGVKSKLGAVVDLILVVAAIVMLISSVAISKDIFSFIGAGAGGSVWRNLHIICAVVMLICVLVHVCLHFSLFDSLMKKKKESIYKTYKFLSRVVALFMAVLVVKASVEQASNISLSDGTAEKPSKGKLQKKTEAVNSEASSSEESENTEITSTQDTADEAPTLEEYLGNLHCNGCGRHCSLLTPQCGRGERQAQVAEAEYDTTYGQ